MQGIGLEVAEGSIVVVAGREVSDGAGCGLGSVVADGSRVLMVAGSMVGKPGPDEGREQESEAATRTRTRTRTKASRGIRLVIIHPPSNIFIGAIFEYITALQ
jgi:hypothetical protein